MRTDGFVLIVQPDAGDLSAWLSTLESSGLQLQRLGVDGVETLDGVGETVIVSREAFEAMASGRSGATFKVWTADTVDMVCSAEFANGHWFLRFKVGYIQRAAERVIRVLVEAGRRAVGSNRLLGLVVDEDAVTEDYDWLQFFLMKNDFKGILPDLLMVPEEWRNRIEGDLESFKQTMLRGLVVFERVTRLTGDISRRQARSDWR